MGSWGVGVLAWPPCICPTQGKSILPSGCLNEGGSHVKPSPRTFFHPLLCNAKWWNAPKKSKPTQNQTHSIIVVLVKNYVSFGPKLESKPSLSHRLLQDLVTWGPQVQGAWNRILLYNPGSLEVPLVNKLAALL